MYGILNTLQLGAIKNKSSVVEFKIATSKHKILTLCAIKLYTVMFCILFAYLDI